MAGTHFVSLTFLLVMLATLSSGHFVGFFRFVAPPPQPPPPPPPPPPPTTTTSSPTPLYRAFFNVAQNLPLVLYNNLVCNTLNQNTATRSLASRRLRYIYYTKTCASTAIPSSIVDVVDYTNLMKKLSSGFLSTQERQAWTNALNSSTLTVLNTIVDWAFGDTSDADIRKVPDIVRTFLVSSTASDQDKKNQLINLLLSLEKKIAIQGVCSLTGRVSVLYLNQYFAKDFLQPAVNYYLSQQGIVGNLTAIIGAISTLYPQKQDVATNFQNLLSGATVSDLPAACYLLDLYAKSPTTPCGTALLAQTAYATLKCTTNSSQPLPPAPTSTTITTTTSTTTRPTTTTTAKPTTTTKPPTTKTTSTTTAKPTTTSTTTSTSTTTTAAPTTASIQNCGASTVASRLASVSSSDFVLSSRIVGGVPVGSCQAIPWQVRLSIDGNELCGASIIDQTHLLTAAHCVPAGAKIEAVAGEYDLFRKESSEQSVQVSKATVHPGYTTLANGALMNDVAVLTLATPLNFSNPCIAPVCLSPTYTVAAGGQKCTVSGWGTTSYQGSVSTQLQSVSIETHQGSECASTFGFSTLTNYVPSPSTQLCAGDPVNGGKDSCQGDSGGPLTCQTASGSYIQVGVVSYGNGCATAQYPGIYASVSAYYDWIQQQL